MSAPPGTRTCPFQPRRRRRASRPHRPPAGGSLLYVALLDPGLVEAVTAVDPFGNVDTNYGGTITWGTSDTDPAVVLPADYEFQASDNGTHTFSAGITLVTVGDQALAVGDTVSSITGTALVSVGPGP